MSVARILASGSGALASGLFLAFGLLACSGTEVPDPTDVVVGQVLGVDGRPAVSARVIALGGPAARQAALYDTGKVSQDTQYTDDRGRFAFGRRLAPGSYDFYFQDPDTLASVDKRPVQHLDGSANGHAQLQLHPAHLVPPIPLAVVARDQGTGQVLDSADCNIDLPFYPHVTTGKEGIAFFFVPPGSYSVSCFYPWSRRDVSIVVPPGSANVQTDIYLTPNGEDPNPLPQPTDLAGTYDGNSGVVDLTWSPVQVIWALRYGVGRQDQAVGGAPTIFFTDVPSYRDVPFDKSDSVQFKNLQYGVYAQKRDGGVDPGSSRRTLLTLNVQRPLAYGPRIDSLAPLDSLGAYHVGDTLRIAAAWTNRIRENDSLFWRVTGAAELARTRPHPAAIGKDTLAFVIPAAGDYQVSLTIRDAEGYRSWLALRLRF